MTDVAAMLVDFQHGGNDVTCMTGTKQVALYSPSDVLPGAFIGMFCTLLVFAQRMVIAV